MPNISECQVAKSDILEFDVLNDSVVAYATKSHGINMFELDECEALTGFSVKNLNSDVVCSAFSPNGSLYAYLSNQTIHVMDMHAQEIIQSIEINGEEIEIVAFDSSSTYIIAGTKNAKVLQYKYDTPVLLSRLHSFAHSYHGDYVSSFAFYSDYMACGGSGGAIYVANLRSRTTRCIISNSTSRSSALLFLDEDTIVSANVRGEISVTSLNDVRCFNSVKTSLLSIKQIIPMQNPDYVMVSGATKSVSIIDIKKYKVSHSKYLEFDADISKIALVRGEHLVIALQNNKILSLVLPGEALLKSFILHNSIEEAFELIAKEPMLMGSHQHTMLLERFDLDCSNATKAFVEQNEKEALEILKPYKGVISMQNAISELFKAFKNYDRFKELTHDKKYALAYAMSSKFPALKHTPQYKRMEHKFKLSFSNAQKLVQNGNINDARALLSDYNAVLSKKPIINMILTHNSEFKQFLQAVQERKYKRIYELIKVNELFKQIPSYISLLDEIERCINGIVTDINNSKIDIAREQLLTLKDIPHVKHRVEQLLLDAESIVKLQSAYSDGNLTLCYEILDLHKTLAQTELGKLLENRYSKIIHQCEEYALQGNISAIKKALGELITMPTRHNRIGDLLKVSFHVRVRQLMSKNDLRAAELIIYSYIDIFGIDYEIEELMKNYAKVSSRKLAVTHNQDRRPASNSWLNSDIVKNYP